MTTRGIPHPPQIGNLSVTHGTRLRFVTNVAVANQTITFQNLLDTFLVATTALAPYDVFYAVKIRAIELWSEPAIGGASTVTVSYQGGAAGLVGDFKVHTDTSMGVQPAHVRAKPSPKSLSSDYQLSSPNGAVVLTCPTGTVVDVELSFIQVFSVGVAAQNASVGATIGAFYCRGLDGLASATTKFTCTAPQVI
jgi:hypothetical protein